MLTPVKNASSLAYYPLSRVGQQDYVDALCSCKLLIAFAMCLPPRLMRASGTLGQSSGTSSIIMIDHDHQTITRD